MKKNLFVILIVSFLFVHFSGYAFCDPHEKKTHAKKNSESFISDNEIKEEGETNHFIDLDEPEGQYFENNLGHPDDEILEKGNEHPFIDSDDEDEKIQDEEERKKMIL